MRFPATQRSLRRRLAVALACAGLAAQASAATPIAGGEVGGQTWTAAGSPYVVAGDLSVAAGSTLTLEPGTVVQFKSADALAAGRDTARVELTVHGALAVNGTAQLPVTFQAETGTAAKTWYGIVVDSSATSAALSHAIVEAAWYGVYSQAPGTALSIQDSTFRSFTTGLYLAAGSPLLEGLTLTGGLEGIYVTGVGTSPTISRTVLAGATSWGAYVTPSGTATVTVTGCTVHGNGVAGLYATSGSVAATLDVVNSNVTGNGSYGIEREGTSIVVNVSSSNVWGNGSGAAFDLWNVTAGTGTLSANPLYAAPPGNLRLTSNSPSRFAGDAGQDLGALPYVNDPTPGLVGTLWADYTAPAGTTDVPGDLTVAPGVTLTLPPGAVLAFAGSDLMKAGVSSVLAELVVLGRLDASGSTLAPVAFRSGTGTVQGWFGIELVSTTAASTLSHATIDGAFRGLRLASTAANTIRDVAIDRPDYGVEVTAGTFELDAITVTSATTAGVWLRGSASGTITNAVLNGSGWYGVYLELSSGTSTVSVVNSTLHGGGHYGFMATAASGAALTASLRNSLVTGNAVAGVYQGARTTLDVTYSDVWGNGTSNYLYATPGAGAISQNPSYVNAPWDLRLQATSVAIDAGAATGAPGHDRAGAPRPLDGDGSGSAAHDLGAYEFVLVSFCGDGHVDAGEACDDGVLNGTYGRCAAGCGGVLRCGDGVKNGPEACDDGNVTPGDGCSATCTVEVAPPAPACGDGHLDAGEGCDDGNTTPGDGCSATCSIEAPPPPPTPSPPAGGGGGGGGGCSSGGLGAGAALLAWLAPFVLRRRRDATAARVGAPRRGRGDDA
jgi:cysteine-rich repeat protein